MFNNQKDRGMTILKLLAQDHKKVKKLLDTIEKNQDFRLFKSFKEEISVHNEIEEKVFYSTLKSRLDNLDILIEANEQEHDQTAELIERISEIDVKEEKCKIFSVIKKSLEAHIAKEESDIFDLAKQHFSSEELEKMAVIFQKLKDEGLVDI